MKCQRYVLKKSHLEKFRCVPGAERNLILERRLRSLLPVVQGELHSYRAEHLGGPLQLVARPEDRLAVLRLHCLEKRGARLHHFGAEHRHHLPGKLNVAHRRLLQDLAVARVQLQLQFTSC